MCFGCYRIGAFKGILGRVSKNLHVWTFKSVSGGGSGA